MKIALISSLYGLEGGGAGLILQYLARGLAEAGYRVTVITVGGRRQVSTSEERGVRVICFRPFNLYPLLEKDRHPAWQKILWQALDIYNLHSAIMLQRVLKREAPDIVHIHKMRGLSGAVWPTASRLFPGRVIQTCHDYESMSPDGLLRGSIGQMSLNRRWPIRGYQLLRARLSAGVSIVTSPSQFTLKRIVESGLFPNAARQVIPNTHGWSKDDLRHFLGINKGEYQGRFQFLYLGRLEQEKGIVGLCEAFLRVSDTHTETGMEIAGWGGLEKKLHRSYSTKPQIKFLGTLRGKDKIEALSRASVVVVPSLVDEVFGLTTIEAYALGKPVIASQVGGLPELVRPGETGWLVRPGDIDDLVGSMIEAAEMNAGRREEMSQACRAYAYKFSLEKFLSSYLDLYAQLHRQTR